MERFNRSQPTFLNANEAFEYYIDEIASLGVQRGNTRALFNVSFLIMNPDDNFINSRLRKWSISYAIREFKWYLSGNRSVEELRKFAPMWDKMHGGDFIVNSNYGYQWQRNGQLQNVIDQLTKDSNSRRAWITILDSKEHAQHRFDTPCTTGIGFFVVDNFLHMTVTMRSNDIWNGFCYDQYCFSELQKLVCNALCLKMGTYHHYAMDLHLYDYDFQTYASRLNDLKYKSSIWPSVKRLFRKFFNLK